LKAESWTLNAKRFLIKEIISELKKLGMKPDQRWALGFKRLT
jgi:hypothetical protein